MLVEYVVLPFVSGNVIICDQGLMCVGVICVFVLGAPDCVPEPLKLIVLPS